MKALNLIVCMIIISATVFLLDIPPRVNAATTVSIKEVGKTDGFTVYELRRQGVFCIIVDSPAGESIHCTR